MALRGGVGGVLLILAAACLGGCANDTTASQSGETPANHLGADLMNMGGARGEQLARYRNHETPPVIEPTSSSKVLSAIVFERITGRTAYPDGTALQK